MDISTHAPEVIKPVARRSEDTSNTNENARDAISIDPPIA